jgi:beta-mannosidase
MFTRPSILLLTFFAATHAEEPQLAGPYRMTPRSVAQHIALDRDWNLGWRDAQIAAVDELQSQSKWIDVSTPTSIHMALFHARELPHPYYNLNSEKYRWTERKVWYYRKAFTVPESARGRYVMLCFDGIAYFARVWLNGQLLGHHEGMFGGPNVEVARWIRYGQPNDVVVEVRSGNWGRWGQDISHNLKNVIQPWVFAGGSAAEAFFVFGMWRGARVEILPPAHLERPFLVTESAETAEAKLRLSVELLVERHSNQFAIHATNPGRSVHFVNSFSAIKAPSPLTVKLELKESATGRIAYTGAIAATEALVGRNWLEKSFTVPAPKLWWPNGMGQPNLYRVELTLFERGRPVDMLAFDYGIRTLRTVRSAGARTEDIWHDWQFVVNGRKFFVKGVDWMPADLVLDLSRERYEWLIGMARNAGIQMFRVWGAGLIETEEFYDTRNRKGILVWQDFTVSNITTADWPQDVWESQVVQNIQRLRNHPSLALYCGGNESNPYHTGNAATIGIFERSVMEFDGTRPYRRTSPDGGSVHEYPDKDPTWYGKEYKLVPFMAETGMHNIPEARSMREVVAASEFEKPLSHMFDPQFAKEHPEFRHHFGEFQPSRVPRMLSRASQIDDMSQPTIEMLSEASQMGAAEFYQVLSEQVQANYPVTAGLIPWVFKRPWPIVAIMLVDGFGQPTAPYYFLQRTYEPTHISVFLPELVWAKGEEVPLEVRILHAPAAGRGDLTACVEVLDDRLEPLSKKSVPVSVKPGPSVTAVSLGTFRIPDRMRERFFFIVAELRDKTGVLVSRSAYWPRCLARMEDEAFRSQYRRAPQPALTFDQGPWLKLTVAATKTTLRCELLSSRQLTLERSQMRIRIRNTGAVPAFPVQIAIDRVKRAFFATENFFWLRPVKTG